MIQFFDIKVFDADVVNILIQVAANALNLNINIFQSNQGKTQFLKYSGGTCFHTIFVKFTHDPVFSGLNHYEPIVKLDIKKEDEDEDVKDDEEGNADGTILDDIIPDIRRGKPFPTYLFSTTKPIEVECTPNDINGFKLYKIHTTDQEWMKVTSDQHYFDFKTSS